MRDLDEMPVAAIKEEIRLRGGKVSGLKGVLVKRLRELRTKKGFINDEELDDADVVKENDEDYKEEKDDEDEELRETRTEDIEDEIVSCLLDMFIRLQSKYIYSNMPNHCTPLLV